MSAFGIGIFAYVNLPGSGVAQSLAKDNCYFATRDQQSEVLGLEEEYQDSGRSGITDFNAFIMEGFPGTGFFHLLLGPFLVTILGAIDGRFERRVEKSKKD